MLIPASSSLQPQSSSSHRLGLLTITSLLALAFEFTGIGLANEQERPLGILLPLRAVRWEPSSFLGDRAEAILKGVSKTMSPLMLGKEKSHFLENFRISAGLSEGEHRGPPWNDGDCYKWIEAISAAYSQTESPELRSILDEAIPIIASAQRSDGYLHTPVLIANRKESKEEKPFADPANFEMYNMGHLMTAASVHFEATGDSRLLDVAKRSADYLDREFSKPDVLRARHAICPAHYMGALDLYRATGEERYLKLCQRWMKMRDLTEGGGDDNQDRIPFSQQREAVGHAVRANYLYAGAADLSFETRDTEWREALEACWESVEKRKIYVTGGCGALFDGASPDGSDKQRSITRIHQAYGRNYQLPNSTAHNETCAAVGHVLWNHRMWRLSRDVKYIDALENSLYNAVLAGVSLDGERFFYTNTLRQLNDMPTLLRWPRERQSWISCYCCPPNVARLMMQTQRFAYCVTESSTDVLLYGSNRLDISVPSGGKLELRQTSSYPLSGRSSIRIEKAPDFEYAIGLRIPGWCGSAEVSVNGVSQKVATNPGSIASISRVWRSGDTIEIDMNITVQFLAAHPLVEECSGQIAVRRGPLVYCVESNDIEDGSSVQQLLIPGSSSGAWELELDHPSLPSVPFLKGMLLKRVSSGALNEQAANLYQSYTPPRMEPVSARLIPYYAWGNRGRSEMSVWIPVQE